jgi:hypothetical protein
MILSGTGLVTYAACPVSYGQIAPGSGNLRQNRKGGAADLTRDGGMNLFFFKTGQIKLKTASIGRRALNNNTISVSNCYQNFAPYKQIRGFDQNFPSNKTDFMKLSILQRYFFF